MPRSSRLTNYKTALKKAKVNGATTAPFVAANLPPGEIVRGLTQRSATRLYVADSRRQLAALMIVKIS
jgi:hypothetical protein